jgi:hypothetical protein
VPGLALTLIVRERRFVSDAAYLAYVRKRNSDLFRKPLYRAIMWVTSPRSLIAGAPRRWEQFHRGTSLEVTKDGRDFVDLVLHFPPRLFNELHARMFGAAFEAAFEAAGALDCVTEDVKPGQTEAAFRVRWRS